MRKIIILCFFVLLCFATGYGQINKEYFFQKGTNELIDRKYSQAIQSFNLLLKIDTGMYDAYFRRAIAKYNLGDAIGALSDFNRAITLNPVFTYAYFYRAVVRNSMGDHQQALKDLEEVETLRPQFSDVYYSRGVSYFYLQQFTQALENCNTYIRYNAGESNGYIMRGTCSLFLQDTVGALADYERAINLNNRSPEGYSRRGRLYALQSKYDLALSDFNNAIALDTGNSLNYYFRAIAYHSIEKIDSALKDFDKVLQLDPYNALVYYNRAIMYTQKGNYDAALADYNKAAEINRGNVLIYYNRAAVYMEKKDYRSAIADFSKAIDLYPNFANAYLSRSYAKRMRGDARGAKSDYDVAQKKISEHQKKMKQSDDITSFADTSRQYSALVNFDADFGNKEFTADLLQYQRADITLQPLYRISIGIEPRVEKDYNKMYFNDDWERFKQQHAAMMLAVMSNAPKRSADERERYELRVDAVIDSVSFRSGIGYFSKATLLEEQNMYNASLNFHKQALAVEHDNPFYHFAYSVAQSEMIDFISSIDQQQTTTIVINNDNSSALQNTRAAETKTYNYAEAIAELDRVVALLPSFAYAYYNRGNLKCRSNQMPEAIEDYNVAIESYPYFADAYYNRGLIQIYMHDTDKGCLDMSKAGELGIKSAYNVIKRYCKTQ